MIRGSAYGCNGTNGIQNQFYLCIYSLLRTIIVSLLANNASSIRAQVINQNSFLFLLCVSFVLQILTRRQIWNNSHSIILSLGCCRKHKCLGMSTNIFNCKVKTIKGFFVKSKLQTVTQTERSMLFYPIRCNGRQTNGLYLNKIRASFIARGWKANTKVTSVQQNSRDFLWYILNII